MRILALFALLFAVASANAGVIDFNSNPDNTYFVTPIYSNGFTFSDQTGEGSIGTATNLDGSSVSNGTVHLMAWTNESNNSIVKMEASDNSLFSLSQFDFTSGYLDGSESASQLSVSGYDSGGNLIANSVFTSSAYNNLSFTTLAVNNTFQNLSYVIFDATGSDNRTGYDNIVVNQTVTTPEPSSLALLALGLVGLGLAKTRKSKS